MNQERDGTGRPGSTTRLRCCSVRPRRSPLKDRRREGENSIFLLQDRSVVTGDWRQRPWRWLTPRGLALAAPSRPVGAPAGAFVTCRQSGGVERVGGFEGGYGGAGPGSAGSRRSSASLVQGEAHPLRICRLTVTGRVGAPLVPANRPGSLGQGISICDHRVGSRAIRRSWLIPGSRSAAGRGRLSIQRLASGGSGSAPEGL